MARRPVLGVVMLSRPSSVRSIRGPSCSIAWSPESSRALEQAVLAGGCWDDEEASYF